MSGGTHIAAVGPGDTPAELPVQTAEPAADTAMAAEEVYELVEEEEPSRRDFGWLVPALAVLADARLERVLRLCPSARIRSAG